MTSNYGTFKCVESKIFKDEFDNSLEIRLLMNGFRKYRIIFIFNQELIAPLNFAGKNSAYEKWKKLTKNLHEGS